MALTLDHVVVPSRDRNEAARFFAEIFDLAVSEQDGFFVPVRADTLTLLFDSHAEMVERLGDPGIELAPQHYAFVTTDTEFDAIFDRIRSLNVEFGSGPFSVNDGKTNNRFGGRGVYFRDPSGHILEVMTRPHFG